MPGCSSLTLERWSFWNNYTRGGGQEGPWSLIEAIVTGVFHCIFAGVLSCNRLEAV